AGRLAPRSRLRPLEEVRRGPPGACARGTRIDPRGQGPVAQRGRSGRARARIAACVQPPMTKATRGSPFPLSLLLRVVQRRAARAREPVLELAFEARSIEEPEHALALRRPVAHFALVLEARLVVIDALPAQGAAQDLAFVAIAIRERVRSQSLRLAADEGRLD